MFKRVAIYLFKLSVKKIVLIDESLILILTISF